jgi:hypothetical protein
MKELEEIVQVRHLLFLPTTLVEYLHSCHMCLIIDLPVAITTALLT